MENEKKIKRPFLEGIQHLRGLAAAMVILGHTNSMSKFDKYYGINILPKWFNNLEFGILGVQLFFVISGFIMVVISTESISLKPIITAKEFLKNRFLRIIPYMWVCIVLYAIVRFAAIQYFPFMLYFKSFILYPVGELAPPYIWTLRHEILFYFLFYLFYLKTQKPWLLYMWFLSPVIWFIINSFFTKGLLNEQSLEWINFFFNKNNLLFGMGFILGVLFKKGYLTNKIYSNLGFIISLASIVLFLAIPLILPAIQKFTMATTLSQIFVIGFLASIVVLIGILINSKEKSSVLDRIGVALGNASYSIYLLHGIMVSAILKIYMSVGIPFNPWLIGLSTTFFATGLGYLGYILLEKPLINLLKKTF